MRIFVTGVALLAIASAAHADEAIPFPDLETNTYCTELVSKMLDANEKQLEFQKCLTQENALKEATRPYWKYLTPKAHKFVVDRHFKEPKNQTYITVLGYVGSAVGEACMITKKLICSPR